jgi:hypothetical protein
MSYGVDRSNQERGRRHEPDGALLRVGRVEAEYAFTRFTVVVRRPSPIADRQSPAI